MKILKFTLVELVVVVFLFFSTAGLLLVRAQTNGVTACADNLRKLASAAAQYAQDYDGVLPGTSGNTGINWQMRLAPYLGYADVEPGWTPKKYPVYNCPDDAVAPEKWLSVNAHIAKISYCANLVLVDFDNDDANVDKHIGGRPVAEVKTPAEVILFAEDHSSSNALRHGANVKCCNKGYTFEYTKQNGTLENDDGKVGYHDYKNNWCMLDGSVAYLGWEETIADGSNKWTLK